MALVDRIESALGSDEQIDVFLEEDVKYSNQKFHHRNKTYIHSIEFWVYPKEPCSSVEELKNSFEKLYNRLKEEFGEGRYIPFHPTKTGGYLTGEICYEEDKSSPNKINQKDRISIQMFPSERYIRNMKNNHDFSRSPYVLEDKDVFEDYRITGIDK
jgi:hypothetical protein